MFREMRRKSQILSQEDALAVLDRGSCGVLAVLGDEGYPYTVPLSYAYHDGALYFHSAKEGHKLDAIRNCPKASFCVVDQDVVVPQAYTTYFRSVVVFGEVSLLEGEAAERAMKRIAEKYSPNEPEEHLQKVMEESFPRSALLELKIRHMTGKEAIELVREKRKM